MPDAFTSNAEMKEDRWVSIPPNPGSRTNNRLELRTGIDDDTVCLRLMAGGLEADYPIADIRAGLELIEQEHAR